MIKQSQWAQPSNWPHVRPCYRLWGLARMASGEFYEQRLRHLAHWQVPWGWRLESAFDRDAVLIMPAWLHWLRCLWWRRYHIIFRPLIRLGLWDCRKRAKYTQGHWTWPWRRR